MTTDTVTISWRDRNVPMNTPIAPAQILQTQALHKAIAHYAIERGGRRARREAWMLVRHVRRLAAQAARQGLSIELSTVNQADAPPTWDTFAGLGLLARAIHEPAHQIRWSAQVFSADNRGHMMWRGVGLHDTDSCFRTGNAAMVARQAPRWCSGA